MSFSSTVTIALALSFTPAAALAHHGWSAYGETPQKIAGVIREVQIANPHATIPLKPGAPATVEGYAHRTAQHEMRAESISLGDTTTPLR